MQRALAELGARCQTQIDLVIVGGAAAVLCHWLTRTTGDVDVVDARPRLAVIEREILEVAKALGLPQNWLNDGAKRYAEILPPDYRDRLVDIGNFEALHVWAVSRRDFVLLKLFAFRDTDFEDLERLIPPLTAAELDFVQAQLPRIARFDAKKAHHIELYLAEGGSQADGYSGEGDENG